MRGSAFLAPARLCLLLFLVAVKLAAQDQGSVFSEKIDVELVELEVVVTDKDGQPVSGVGREEFVIEVDGVPVEITNYLVIGGEPVAGDGTTLPEVKAETATADDRLPLNLVIFVDNLNIHPTSRNILFQELRESLARVMDGRTRAMLVAMNNEIEVIEPLTARPQPILDGLAELEQVAGLFLSSQTERRSFLAQLQRASLAPVGRGTSGGAPGSGSSRGLPTDDCPRTEPESLMVARNLAGTARGLAEQQMQRTRATASVVGAFASLLGGLPGRKALVFLSDGLGQRPGDSYFSAWSAKYDSWVIANQQEIARCHGIAVGILQRMMTATGSSEFDLHAELERVTRSASDSGVVLYPISASGRHSEWISASVAGSVDGASGALMRGAQIAESQQRDASMLQMADGTGGLAFTGSANVGALLERIETDFSSHYSLGFPAPDPSAAGQLHEVRVSVRREGLQVRHLKSFRVKGWRETLGDVTAATALLGVENNLHGLRLVVEAAEQKGKRHRLTAQVQIPFPSIQMVDSANGASAKLTLLAILRDGKGRFAEPVRVDLPIDIPAEHVAQIASQAMAYVLNLESKSRPERLAVGLYDHLARSASSVILEIEATDRGEAPRRRNSG